MFKTPSLTVQLSKTPNNKNTPDTTVERSSLDFDKINTLVQTQAQNLAKIVVGVYVVIKVVDTASEIAINAAPKR